MHLAELLTQRARPAAGLLLALTDRCPLSCAHCSTDSRMDSPQPDGEPLLRLVGSFTAEDHPQLIFMSGGEPLLRPALVTELARLAGSTGTRSCLLSGMFFARQGVPAPIRRAIGNLDHFSASIDLFHEREVSRDLVFAALRVIADLVPAISLHIAAHDDGYVDTLLADVRRAFGTNIPALVTPVQPTGRATAFVSQRADPQRGADPCEFASWPLVDIDGTVFACSRQSLARRHRPGHLVLGHAATDSWPQLLRRAEADPILRAVRVLGPVESARRANGRQCAGACQTCVALTDAPPVSAATQTLAGQMLSRVRPRDLARRWGAGRHAELVEVGWTRCAD